MSSSLAVDPARELASLRLPVMIVTGGHDLQVSEADAALLAKARPDAARLDIPDINHVLKSAPASRTRTRTRACRSRRASAMRSRSSCGAPHVRVSSAPALAGTA
jgi:hypothetical protein